MKRFLTKKNILLALAAIFIVIQFFQPKKNESNDQTNHIAKAFAVPAPVENILKVSCYDCHSNQTVYPWYNNIQPVAWFLDNHVREGKRELNFSEFSHYSLRRQYHKFEEIMNEVGSGDMPDGSFTIIHRDAALDDNQRQMLINWAKGCRDTMAAHNPIDSLVRKKR
jgi:hypothetical protein